MHRLRENGVTIILTTHYIEEAEEMADRIAVINKGEIVMVEEKTKLMNKLGKKQLTLTLQTPLSSLPEMLFEAVDEQALTLQDEGETLVYAYDTQQEQSGIPELLRQLDKCDINIKDLHTSQSSLEDIFVSLVREKQ
ncbi:MAG TPA: hypothetical protein ENJ65_03240 [Candidatus Tenderia electrophaga]|uniref:DUF4162 domain-containing protein n=1 Tax=Candidatus Tenderia electrophaga TaxID=1748243 RepID=A0A832J8A5_9GAMM|nr:hypothetical protein [Candidatus Tenderia electrophaga]